MTSVSRTIEGFISTANRLPWPSIENTRTTRVLLSALGVVLFFTTWFVLVDLTQVMDPQFYPTLTEVTEMLIERKDPIINALRPTLQATFVGFGAALVLSLVIGVALTANERALSAFMPLIVGANTVPRITLAPLIIFYIDVMVVANYIIAAWVAFFPMLINTIDGLSLRDEDTENMLRLYGATTWQEFKYVRFKRALPFIFDGLKTGIILAAIGAVVGEIVAADSGIGNIAFLAVRYNNFALAVAVVAVMGAFGLVSIFVIYAIQKRVIFWQDASLFQGE